MSSSSGRASRAFALAVLLLAASIAPRADTAPADASSRLSYDPQLQERLAASPFGEPLYVAGEERAGALRVDVYGLFPHAFAVTANALTAPADWCEFTPLHSTISACTYRSRAASTWLTFYLRAGMDAPVIDGYAWSYRFRVLERNERYAGVLLEAPAGPLDTRNFRILLEAVPAASDTLVRVRASYDPSVLSRAILATYANTFGRAGVGFSVKGVDRERQPTYVRGRQALVERAVMRGYLALQAFLDTLHVPEVGRFEARLKRWLELSQRYPRQLRGPAPEDYIEIKRRQREQQLKLQAAP